jgi:hypothetical protein
MWAENSQPVNIDWNFTARDLQPLKWQNSEVSTIPAVGSKAQTVQYLCK